MAEFPCLGGQLHVPGQFSAATGCHQGGGAGPRSERDAQRTSRGETGATRLAPPTATSSARLGWQAERADWPHVFRSRRGVQVMKRFFAIAPLMGLLGAASVGAAE